MKGIQLKLKGEWIALPKDFSLKLEQTNPLFNEQGTFSFPFEVPLEPNRSLFKNISDPFGDIRLKDIDGMEAELWFNGVMLYKGLVETDEEVEFEDSIPLTFLSGNSDFKSRIEGLNIRDIPMDRNINLGYIFTEVFFPYSKVQGGVTRAVPPIFMKNKTINISDPYPAPYCNVRICTNAKDDNGNTVEAKKLEADRPFSAPCFYVLYILDLLMKKLNISFSNSLLMKMEDMNRLAFFSVACDYILDEKIEKVSLSDARQVFGNIEFKMSGPELYVDLSKAVFTKKEIYASNKCLPNVDVDKLIQSLENAFGIRFIYNTESNHMNVVFLKDIFRSNETELLNITILTTSTGRIKENKYKVTYSEKEDVAFNYLDWSNIKTIESYQKLIRGNVGNHDTTCYYDEITGNAYRVKVDKSNGNNPILFEVGGFNPYIKGDGNEVSELNIDFSPVIVNDLNYKYEIKNTDEQLLAVFVDVELKNSSNASATILQYTGTDFFTGKDVTTKIIMETNIEENYNIEEGEESPLRSYDTGFVLGVMRGPGNKSKIEYITNYDGEGNSSWFQVADNYAFTSDSCDNYGRFFDYNGTEAGGAEQTGRFSLKLVAGKDGFPIDSQYADRGLVSKFLSEYLYFLENRKTVILEVEMRITQLINIDFLKRYKISDFVGFINKVSYNLTVNGMEDVVIEMYTL